MKVFLFLTGLLVPMIMFVAGWIMQKHPPRNINWVVGYRTARSMKNMDTWLLANRMIGRIWKKAGAFSLMVSAVVQIPFFFFSIDAFSVLLLILLFAQLALLFVTISPVERALKREFPDIKEKK